MPQSPYFKYIQVYFPEDQWENGDCISTHECSPDRDGYPGTCIGPEGMISCNPGSLPYLDSYSYGVFQILDACWSPERNPDTPFTPDIWARVMDPNVNTWMASVIWSRNGWRAWSTCGSCSVCGVMGRDIPFPRGPLTEAEVDELLGITPPPPPPIGSLLSATAPIIVGIGLLVGSVVLINQAQKGAS